MKQEKFAARKEAKTSLANKMVSQFNKLRQSYLRGELAGKTTDEIQTVYLSKFSDEEKHQIKKWYNANGYYAILGGRDFYEGEGGKWVAKKQLDKRANIDFRLYYPKDGGTNKIGDFPLNRRPDSAYITFIQSRQLMQALHAERDYEIDLVLLFPFAIYAEFVLGYEGVTQQCNPYKDCDFEHNPVFSDLSHEEWVAKNNKSDDIELSDIETPEEDTDRALTDFEDDFVL